MDETNRYTKEPKEFAKGYRSEEKSKGRVTPGNCPACGSYDIRHVADGVWRCNACKHAWRPQQ